jgi:hypothetical protein
LKWTRDPDAKVNPYQAWGKDGLRAVVMPMRTDSIPEAFQPLVKGAAKNPKAGGATLDFLSLGLAPLIREDINPTLRNVAQGIAETGGDLTRLVFPTLLDKTSRRGSLIFRRKLAELARKSDTARVALGEDYKYFEKQPKKENYEFIRRMEAGAPQKTPQLDAIAATLRKLLDDRRLDVQALGTGKLRGFYENYFPHIWKDWRKAQGIFAAFFGRRPLEGPKAFLKKRSMPTFEDGLNAGLEPVSDNPVALVLAKVHEMDRYVMAHQTLNEWKRTKLARFVDARTGKAPIGWPKIEDAIGTVYGPSIQQISESPNEGLWSGLDAVANALGLTHKRGFEHLPGGALGVAYRGKPLVKTRHGSAEDTFAHEIGHQIDWLAGSGKHFVLEYPDAQTVARLKAAYKTLKDKSSTEADRKAARAELKDLKAAIADRKEFARQLRDLADLRTGGTEAYRRKREEKMAQLAQMWAGARPLFERTAPLVFKRWKAFLDANPKLHALRDIEASANSTLLSQPYDVGGLVIKGHWYAPDGAARIMHNYLTPGLRRYAGYRLATGLNNALNSFQLGLSAFHLGFTTVDTTVSKAALAWQAALTGHPVQAAKFALQTPTAAIQTLLEGHRMLREWEQPGTQGAAVKRLTDAMVTAGGRGRMEQMYRTHMAENMRAAFRRGNVLGAAIRAPFAGMEAISNLLMNQVVPRMKMGAFADLARFHLDHMDPNAGWEDVSRVLADDWNSIDNRLGEMVYDNLFWDRMAKDLAHLTVRSVGWNLGTLREIGGGLLDVGVQPYNKLKGKPVNLNRLTYLLGLVTVNAVMSATYQYLKTGKGPDEPMDYFFPKNGEVDEHGRPQRVSWPTYVKDVYHYSTHPGRTLAGKVSPILSSAAEMWNNRDFYGNRIRNSDDPLVQQLKDAAVELAKQAVPIAVRQQQREKKLGASVETQAEQFFGVTAAPADLRKTAAERLEADISAEAAAGEPGRPPEVAERRDLRLALTRALRQGKPVPKEVNDAIRAGKLRSRDVQQAYTESRQSQLQAGFTRLTFADAMKVYNAATPEEKRQLKARLYSKGVNALKSGAIPADKRLEVSNELRQVLAGR